MGVSDPVCDAFYPRATATTSEDELKQILRDFNECVARQHFAISLLQPIEYSLCQPLIELNSQCLFSLFTHWVPPARPLAAKLTTGTLEAILPYQYA